MIETSADLVPTLGWFDRAARAVWRRDGLAEGGRGPSALDLAMLPLLYFLAAKIGVGLTTMPEGIAILWPPNGILLAFLIRLGPRRYVACAALVVAAEVAADLGTFTVIEALLFAAVNIAEATAAAVLLARWRFNPAFPMGQDLIKFILAAPVLASAAAAVAGAYVYHAVRGSETAYLELVRIWWFGDALGLTIVTPLALVAGRAIHSIRHGALTFSVGDVFATVGAAGAVALLLGSRDGMLMGVHVGPVLLLPFVIYVAVRGRMAAALTAAAAVASLILVLTTRGHNPFGDATARAAAVHAQEFIFVMAVMALGLSVILEQLRAGRATLEAASEETRALNAHLERRVHERTYELERALSQVKRLHGLLPICGWCRKIRADGDYWQSVEEYVVRHTEARFTHGICPTCADKFCEPRTGPPEPRSDA